LGSTAVVMTQAYWQPITGVHAVSFSNVDQTTPVGTAVFNQGNDASVTDGSLSVSTVAHNLILAVYTGGDAPVVAGGQTGRWRTTDSQASGGGTSTSGALTWAAASGAWAVGGVDIKAATGGGSAGTETTIEAS